MILGLDISTACSGISIMDYNGELIHVEHLVMNKPVKNPPSFYERVDKFRERLMEIKANYEVTKIFIEAPIKAKGSKTSNNTLVALLQMNGIVSYLSRDIFGVEPIHLEARSARAKLGIRLTKEERKNKVHIKEKVLQKMLDLGFDIQVDLKRTGKVQDYVYDESDSVLIAYTGYLQNFS